MVVNCRRKDIAIVLEYLNTNNAPPSILQANTSKKVSSDCSFAHPPYFWYRNRDVSLILLPEKKSFVGLYLVNNFFKCHEDVRNVEVSNHKKD